MPAGISVAVNLLLEHSLQFGLLQSFCIFCHDEVVNAVLDVAVHEGCQVVDGIVDTVVGDASLWIVVGTDFCTAVTGADQTFAARCNVIDILLVLAVIDERTQACKGTFLVLRLVACLGTFYKYFLNGPCHRIFPVVAESYARFHFVDILSAGTAGAEGIPFDFAFVDADFKGIGLDRKSVV